LTRYNTPYAAERLGVNHNDGHHNPTKDAQFVLKCFGFLHKLNPETFSPTRDRNLWKLPDYTGGMIIGNGFTKKAKDALEKLRMYVQKKDYLVLVTV
jgi:DNA polymerase III epsilon subunit-like protein